MTTRLACDRDELDQLAGTYETMVLEHDEYFKQILEMSLQTEKLIKKFYEGNAKGLVSTLIQRDMLTAEDYEELRQFWEEENKSR